MQALSCRGKQIVEVMAPIGEVRSDQRWQGMARCVEKSLIVIQEYSISAIKITIFQKIRPPGESPMRRKFHEFSCTGNVAYLFCDNWKYGSEDRQHATEFEIDVFLSPRSAGIISNKFIVQTQGTPISKQVVQKKQRPKCTFTPAVPKTVPQNPIHYVIIKRLVADAPAFQQKQHSSSKQVLAVVLWSTQGLQHIVERIDFEVLPVITERTIFKTFVSA